VLGGGVGFLGVCGVFCVGGCGVGVGGGLGFGGWGFGGGCGGGFMVWGFFVVGCDGVGWWGGGGGGGGVMPHKDSFHLHSQERKPFSMVLEEPGRLAQC